VAPDARYVDIMLDSRTRPWLGLAALGAVACLGGRPTPPVATLQLTSVALQPDAPIPAPYACTDYEHLGHSPPLSWSPGPAGTVAYAVTVVDPDARGFVHWALAGVPATVTSLPEAASPGGVLPAGAVELPNGFGKKGYGGPCPPPGAPHHYVFKLTALGAAVDASKADAAFFAALDAHALATGSVTVTYER
jgi:Raf kinase inhibitor-like YbhB/YbcL family protein